MTSKASHIASLAKAVGWTSTLSILGRRALKRRLPVTVRTGGQSIQIRPVDSDLFVAGQIFGAKEYDIGKAWPAINALARRWIEAGSVPVILDIGANVGYSAIYFAQSCLDAIVFAVEADRKTFEFMCKNVAAYPSIRPVHAAVWSHEDGVDFGPPSALGSWAGRVDGESGATPSLLLSSVYADVPNARPLIVKLDVEGAEREICASAPAIFREAPVILIEPHDFMLPGAGCLSPIFSALADRDVDTLLKGENLMFIDSALRAKKA